MAKQQDDDDVFNASELMEILKKYNLTKIELRRAIRGATRWLYAKEQTAINKGWGIKTGRLSREGLKLGVSSKDERSGGAAYRLYFSKKSGPRGTPEYMADTFKARWLEGGTKQHYTAKGATKKKARKGQLMLTRNQRKLMHPGFAAKPVIIPTVNLDREQVVEMARRDITKILIKKGATNGNDS